MKIDILTLFPEMFKEVFATSILKRAQNKKLLQINIFNLRDWTNDKHRTVDDTPYGGGAGMVLKVDVIDRALRDLKTRNSKLETRNKFEFSNVKKSKQVSDFGFRASDFQNQLPYVVMLTPKGKTFNQKIAVRLSKKKQLILVCGHYEGFDERVRKLVDKEFSIGNYILTGGEIPAMVLVDSISRLVPGVINSESLKHESFSLPKKLTEANEAKKLKLEYPQYTRPKIYQPISIKTKKNLRIPRILLSGNHKKIERWRNKKRKILK